MLKRFFVTILGTIAGFWISLFLLALIGIGIVGAILTSETKTTTDISKKSVLYLDLTGSLPERVEAGTLMEILRDGIPEGDGLIDILNSIREAKNDSKIEGIYINADGSSAGYASREEIVKALIDFKKSGKWIYAYADSYAQGDYLISSLADSVFVNPVGNIDVRGIASQIPFFTNLFDKLGIKMHIFRVGTYKSAVEPFLTTEMSPASRYQTQVMLDSLWRYYTGVVSEARNVSESDVNMWADSIIFTWDSHRVQEAGAVSALRYRRNVENMLKEKCGKDAEDELTLVSPSTYMTSKKKFSGDKKHIAVLVATGDIVDSGNGGIVGDVMTPEIVRLADDEKVGALVMRVNSGGGSAFASEQIWEALEYFKSKDKPFYVSMGDVAASGGYYISCGADKIYADRTTFTGSIGVFGMLPDFSGLVTDKIGITFSTVETNPNAAFPSAMSRMTTQQADAMQHSVEDIYEVFTGRVAAGRGMSQDSVKAIAEGRVWVGGDALRLGLVDELGGLHDAITEIAKKSDIKEEHVVYYPKVEDKLLVSLLTSAQNNVSLKTTTFDSQAITIMRMLDGLSTMNPIQARMPEIIVR